MIFRCLSSCTLVSLVFSFCDVIELSSVETSSVALYFEVWIKLLRLLSQRTRIRWCICLRHFPIIWKVAGSIPDGSLGFLLT